jgi:quinolinate synthase
MNNELIEKINRLKTQKNAVILAHNYQPGHIQDLADFTGDSLGLSRQAADTDADIIVFCGVLFMAETAAILSPEKTVLMPEVTAGCPMADMITASQLREMKEKHPNALVVCYVNSSAEVKAESDYCCTSANAVEVVASLPENRPIIFVPDQHLGKFAAERTGRELILWPGYCPSHVVITTDDIRNLRAQHPDALVLTHPECSEPVKDISDHMLSTGQMLRFVGNSDAKTFIIATEKGIIHALQKVRPDATFVAASERAVCPNMKKTTLDKILFALEDNKHVISVPEPTRTKARKALDRMVQTLPTK